MTVIALPFPSYSERPLRVLTPELSERIARVQHTRQRLRDCGVSVISQDLRAVPRPVLQVEPQHAATVASLAQAVRTRARRVTALIDGVDVVHVRMPQP